MLILLLPSILAESLQDFNEHRTVETSFHLKGAFELHKGGEKSIVESVSSAVSFVPINNFQQTITSYKTEAQPQAEIERKEQETVFTWKNPRTETFSFITDATIKIENGLVVIREKTPFPLTNVDKKYIEESEFIDISPGIRNKAQELAAGEDDLYQVAFNVAEWTQENINYSLETLTADVVQKASWVYDNKFGVCDELTNVFIAMMRSLGVPARFVSGMAYTNINYQWGPHAWAEVYFPGRGWVPFDVTYGQYGWIDPSHIKFKESLDSNEASVKYEWRSYDTSFTGKELELQTELIQLGEKIQSPVEISIKPIEEKLAPGSYVPLEITVRNPQTHYLPETITITKAFELTEQNTKRILLEPEQTKTIYWITKIPEEAQRGYIYTLVIEVEESFHKKGSTNVSFGKGFEYISREEAEERIKEFIPHKNGVEIVLPEEKSEESKTEIREEVKIKIEGLPQEIRYNQEVEMNIMITTGEPIQNVELFLNDEKITHAEEIRQANQITVKAEGKNFFKEEEIKIRLVYEKNGERKEEEMINAVDIVKVPWVLKLLKVVRIL